MRARLGGIAYVGGVFEAGLSMATAASIVGVLGMGSFMSQYPAGLAADRFVPCKVFAMACAALLLCAAALIWDGPIGSVVSGAALQYASSLGLVLWLGSLSIAMLVLSRLDM